MSVDTKNNNLLELVLKEAGVERQGAVRLKLEEDSDPFQFLVRLKGLLLYRLRGEGLRNTPSVSCPLPPAFRGRSLGN